MDHSINLSIPIFFKLKIYKCITGPISAICCRLHIAPINLFPLAAKQEPYKKAYLLMKNIEKKFWRKVRRMGQQAHTEKAKTETVTVLGRRTREEIAKWNQMTALRF